MCQNNLCKIKNELRKKMIKSNTCKFKESLSVFFYLNLTKANSDGSCRSKSIDHWVRNEVHQYTFKRNYQHIRLKNCNLWPLYQWPWLVNDLFLALNSDLGFSPNVQMWSFIFWPYIGKLFSFSIFHSDIIAKAHIIWIIHKLLTLNFDLFNLQPFSN